MKAKVTSYQGWFSILEFLQAHYQQKHLIAQ